MLQATLNMEATPHKAEAVRLPTTHHENYPRTRHAGHCWRSRDELISDVLQWAPSHGRAKAGRPARTNIQQLCDDTGYSPEGLLEAMNDREGWRGRESEISVLMARQDDDEMMTVSVCFKFF